MYIKMFKASVARNTWIIVTVSYILHFVYSALRTVKLAGNLLANNLSKNVCNGQQ